MAEKFDMLIQSLGISIKVVTASDYDALAAELAGKRDSLDWVTCERDELRTKVAALEAALRDVVAYFGARNVHPMVQRLAALLPITAETESHAERVSALEATLGEIASRTDWTRDDCGKAAHDALGTAETPCEHSQAVRIPEGNGSTRSYCPECGKTLPTPSGRVVCHWAGRG